MSPSSTYSHAPLLMAALALPLAAQGAPSYTIDAAGPKLEVAVHYPVRTTHILWVAASPRLQTVGTAQMLAEPFMFTWAFHVEDAQWTLPFSAAEAANHGVFLQDTVFEPHMINGSVISAATAFVPTFSRATPSGLFQNVTMSVLPGLAAQGPTFVADFKAPGDGYSLLVQGVIRHNDQTDIYLAIQAPGPATIDRVQENQLHVEVPLGVDPGSRVCVLGVEGSDPAKLTLAQSQPCISLAIPSARRPEQSDIDRPAKPVPDADRPAGTNQSDNRIPDPAKAVPPTNADLPAQPRPTTNADNTGGL